MKHFFRSYFHLHKSQRFRNRLGFWMRLLVLTISIVVLGVLIVDYGFQLDSNELAAISRIYQWAFRFYMVAYSFYFVLLLSQRKRIRFFSLLTMLLLLLYFLPALSSAPYSFGWFASLCDFLASKYYLMLVLALCSVLGASQGVLSLVSKRTNPALLLAGAFMIFIFIGTLLLMVPRSTIETVRLSATDALFVATSAVCVTGLSPLEIGTTFTLSGQLIIACLIQIGGLGIMTVTSFFALFFMGDTRLYNQLALKDMIGSDSFSSILSTLRHIVFYTLSIEAVGALLLWLNIHGDMGMSTGQEVFFALFHSLSAFCNAGFSTLTGNLGNPAIMSGHNEFFLIISLLIVLGGIGFPVLVNLQQLLVNRFKRLRHKFLRHQEQPPRRLHLATVNTRIVIRMTLLFILLGTVALALVEWNGAFAQMPVADKLVHSLFNAIAPRTAGFNSVDLTRFSFLGISVYLFLMWIGGASQSTAGGIKVNTFAVASANFISILRGRDQAVLLKRQMTDLSVRRASATIFGSLLCIALFFWILLLMEPNLTPKELFFETVSAIGTVGSSLNVTPRLGNSSKLLISALMFIGRVGLITVLMGIIPHKTTPKYHFPKDNVIIN